MTAPQGQPPGEGRDHPHAPGAGVLVCGGPSACMDDLCRNSTTGLCGFTDDDFRDEDDDDISDDHWGPCCETGECDD